MKGREISILPVNQTIARTFRDFFFKAIDECGEGERFLVW